MLFAAKSPFVWVAESNFNKLMAENPDIGRAHQRNTDLEAEKGLHDINTEHEETVSHH